LDLLNKCLRKLNGTYIHHGRTSRDVEIEKSYLLGLINLINLRDMEKKIIG
jgi:hypothetical protein